jgi:cyclohexadieny/prephenate dehydrogenase
MSAAVETAIPQVQRPFARAAVIGTGHIGSSLIRAMRRVGAAREIIGFDASEAVRQRLGELAIVDSVAHDIATAVGGADLVVVATPLGAYKAVAEAIAPHLAPGTIVTDTGSVKRPAMRDIAPAIPQGVHLVPGHPIAGTENSGPDSGFAELFQGRWCILTPIASTDPDAVERVAAIWRAAGSMVELMDPDHHDQVLAITSHLPHLIAYTIVGTATDLEEHLKAEVIRYSASGFRDFTRIAASDPVMWRDIFLNNRDAVLEMLGRLYEDLAILQRAIRVGDGETLEAHFTRTRAIRRGIVEAKQA